MPLLPEQISSAPVSSVEQEEPVETRLSPFPPSIAKPDLALQGRKKENESHFLEQGSETGITPLRSYFQPEISCILGDDAPSGTGEPGWPALYCQKINPFAGTNLFSFHRQPNPGEGLCVRIYTRVR